MNTKRYKVTGNGDTVGGGIWHSYPIGTVVTIAMGDIAYNPLCQDEDLERATQYISTRHLEEL